MNAHELLTSQGWRGTGHSLHPTSNSIGLSKPLLVSKKQNNLGLGKKQHRTSDMWWMNAFDNSLKGLDTSIQGVVVQTVTSGGLDMVAKGGGKWVGSGGGLYASFVRGECLSGTITPESTDNGYGEVPKKRKREDGTERSKEEKRARKAARRAAREVKLVASEDMPTRSETANITESKEERRARKAAKRTAREIPPPAVEEISRESVKSETKAERKARKAAKRALRAQESATAKRELAISPKIENAIENRKEKRRERKRLKELGQNVEGDKSEQVKKKRRKE